MADSLLCDYLQKYTTQTRDIYWRFIGELSVTTYVSLSPHFIYFHLIVLTTPEYLEG